MCLAVHFMETETKFQMTSEHDIVTSSYLLREVNVIVSVAICSACAVI